MNYLSSMEAAKAMGITVRRVQQLSLIHIFHISFVITHFTDRRDRLIPGVSEIVKPAPLISYLFCAPVIGCMRAHKPAFTRFIVCFAGISFIYLIS